MENKHTENKHTENKHTEKELKQLRALPLSSKIIRTKSLIRAWYEHFEGNVYVSFSGGKDSTVLKHITDSLYTDVPSVFMDTGLEYPEIRRFVRRCGDGMFKCCGLNDNVQMIRPNVRFDEVIKNLGYPVISKEISQLIREARIGADRCDGSYQYRLDRLFDRGRMTPVDGKKSRFSASRYNFLLKSPFPISEKCCEMMKKKPFKTYEKKHGNRCAIIGTMASESALRNQRWLRYGCNAFGDKKRPTSNPLSFWTEQDILEYLADRCLPIAEVYKGIEREKDRWKLAGVSRTGCMFCMFGLQAEAEPNRLQRMKDSHPVQYEYCMKSVSEGGLGLKDVIDWINENGGLRRKIKY